MLDFDQFYHHSTVQPTKVIQQILIVYMCVEADGSLAYIIDLPVSSLFDHQKLVLPHTPEILETHSEKLNKKEELFHVLCLEH